jgi:hypothetical protein
LETVEKKERSKVEIERTHSESLVVNKLPDGSSVIVDPANEMVFALNATASAAWDACSNPTTLSAVTEQMQRSLDPAITEELAEEAILQLQEQKLMKTSGKQPTRRQFIATLGAAALPLVVSLPIAEQRAYAQQARSGGSSTTSPSTPPTSIPPSGSDGGGHGIIWKILHLLLGLV